MSVRIGVLGGTFDPVHYGHLILAEEARAAVPLDQVLLVPAGQPPHKLDEPHTPARHRLAMLELAIAGNPALGISRVDVDRPGPHYSVDMVHLVRQESPPDAEIFFIMGLDSLTNILSWHDPAGLLAQCRLIVAERPGYAVDLAELVARLPALEGRVDFIAMPLIQISGADLRRRVRQGRPIRYQAPETVRAYIEQHRLYQAGTDR